MSSALQDIFNRLFPSSQTFRTLILGLEWSGKTTFLYFLKLGEIVQTVHSPGFNVETVDVPLTSGNKRFKMTAWDIGTGCAGFRSLFGLVALYFQYSDAVIWLVDASDRESLQDSVTGLRDILVYAKDRELEGTTIPILILGSKSDKPNSLSHDEIGLAFSTTTSGRLSSVFNVAMTEDTCKNFESSGLAEAFDWLNLALGITKSMKESKKAASPAPAPQPANPRAPNVLAQRLESWLVRSEDDISSNEFLDKFKTFSLPEFDHYAHIRVAYLILTKYGRKEGKDMIFKDLAAYITNSEQTKTRAFHLTMTYFWIQIVHLGVQNMSQNELKPKSLNEFARFLLVNPHVIDGNLWSDFYSKDVMMSMEAKARMVLPDKKPLPNVVTRDAITTFGAS